jgi:hypothetical protein
MREGDAIRERLAALAPNERMFRINAGTGFCGTHMHRTGDRLIIDNPRPLHAAPIGWPDLCGWETVTVTEAMVGQKIAVFVGEEFKVARSDNGRLRPEQRKFGELLERMGGVFRVVRPGDAAVHP